LCLITVVGYLDGDTRVYLGLNAERIGGDQYPASRRGIE
jgi:hypothetical protein